MLVGRVIKGNGLGKGFGFPTANLDIKGFDFEEKQGVYAGYAFWLGNKYKTAVAILSNPNKFEVHFLDFDSERDFYGESIEVELVEKVSKIGEFDSKEKLITKIVNDIEKIREILK